MLKQRRLAADQIADALFEAEAAIDAALAKTANLAGSMPAMRSEAGLSALIGQDALGRAMETLMALAQARSAIVATHRGLSVAQRQAGLGAISYGGEVEKPPEADVGEPSMRSIRKVIG
jgi:hypothetical protein